MVGGVGCDEGGAVEAGGRLRGGRAVGTAGAGEVASRRRAGLPAWARPQASSSLYTPWGIQSTPRSGILEAGVLGVGVEVGVGVHLVEFGAFFLHGLADQAEGQARRIAFPG